MLKFNFHNISTPTPPGDVSWNANGVLDTISSPNKLIIIGNASNRYPVVFVCDLNMTSCNSNSINLTNQFLNDNSTSVIDPINRKLFMFGYNIDLDSALFLHRCNLDGTSCTTRNLSVLAKTNATGDTPVGVLDLPNKKIYVVSENKAFGSVPSYWSIPLYIEDP